MWIHLKTCICLYVDPSEDLYMFVCGSIWRLLYVCMWIHLVTCVCLYVDPSGDFVYVCMWIHLETCLCLYMDPSGDVNMYVCGSIW